MAVSYPDLQGKVVIVTRAATGIGAAVAEAFGVQGSVVAVVSRRRDRLAALSERISAAGGTPVPIEAEVAVEADAEAAVRTVVSQAGGVDVLVNNAGDLDRPDRVRPRAAERRTRGGRTLAWARLWARAATAQMPGSGVIVNVDCPPGPRPDGDGAAADGMFALTRRLAHELAPRVRVNCVAPAAEDRPPGTPAQAGPARTEQPADPLEPAWPVVFLASEAASFITGAILSVNLGRRMR